MQQCYRSWLCSWVLVVVIVFVLVPWFVAGGDSSCNGQGKFSAVFDSFLLCKVDVVFGFLLPWVLRPLYVGSCADVPRPVLATRLLFTFKLNRWLSSDSGAYR